MMDMACTKFTVSMDKEFYRSVRAFAKEDGRTISGLVRRALADFLKERDS